MKTAEFIVTIVFDLPGRGGLLAVGRLVSGQIAEGSVLHDALTGLPVRVLGVELAGGSDSEKVTLVVNRQDIAHLVEGHRLIGE